MIGDIGPQQPGPHMSGSEIGLVFSPKSDLLAFSYPFGSDFNNRAIQVWDIEAGKKLAELPTPNLTDQAVFSPDGTSLYIEDTSGGGFRVWNIYTQQVSILLETPIYSNIAFSYDGRFVAVGSSGPEFWIFNTQTHQLIQHVSWETPTRFPSVRKLLFKPDGKQLLVITNDSIIDPPDGDASIYIFGTKTGMPVTELHGDPQTAGFWASLNPEGGWTILSSHYSESDFRTAYDTKSVKVWDIQTEVSTLLFQSPEFHRPTNIIFSPDGELIGISREYHYTFVCNLIDSICADQPIDTDYGTKFGLDGSILLDWRNIWSVKTKKMLVDFTHSNISEFLLQIDLSPDGTIVGGLFANGTIYLWTVPTF